MADQKISGLPADTSLDDNHYVLLNDPTGPTTKRTTLGTLRLWLASISAWVKAVNIDFSTFVLRKNFGSASTMAGMHIEMGYETAVPGASSQGVIACTFQTPFTEIPAIFTDFGGDQTSGSAAMGSGSNVVQGKVTTKHVDDTVNGFNLRYYADAAWASGNRVYATWVAFGK